MAGGLAEPDVAWDHRFVDLAGEHFADLFDHLLGEVRPLVVHRHDDPIDGQAGVQPLPHERDRLHQLRNPFQGQVLALHGDEHGVGRGQRVEREQAQRGRAVDEDLAVTVAIRRE